MGRLPGLVCSAGQRHGPLQALAVRPAQGAVEPQAVCGEVGQGEQWDGHRVQVLGQAQPGGRLHRLDEALLSMGALVGEQGGEEQDHR